jgi:hypothetical protein
MCLLSHRSRSGADPPGGGSDTEDAFDHRLLVRLTKLNSPRVRAGGVSKIVYSGAVARHGRVDDEAEELMLAGPRGHGEEAGQ